MGYGEAMSLPWHVDPMPQVRRMYRCRRAPGPLDLLDGRLDKPFWQAAAVTEPFVDILGLPPAHPMPCWPTRAKMLWDDEHLYVGAWMDEPHLWATLTQRDSIVYHDNDFEVFLSPTGDNHDYYEIEVNALGTIFDLHLAKPYRDGGPADHDWDCEGLRVGIHLDGTLNDPRDTDRGWSVELAIPWRALNRHDRLERAVPMRAGGPPRTGDAWRINFSRVQWELEVVHDAAGTPAYRKKPDTPEHNWVWSPQGIIDMHRPEMWGEIVFENGGANVSRDAAAAPHDWRPYDWLHAAYYAQRRFHMAHGRFAQSLVELTRARSQDIQKLAPAPEGWHAEILAMGNADDDWLARLRKDDEVLTIRRDSKVMCERISQSPCG